MSMQHMSDHCHHQLNLFRCQYLQLKPDLKYPDSECLRKDAFQQALLEGIFGDKALVYKPPQRYQLRILKELVRRIEDSITNWEKEGISDDLVSLLGILFATPLPSETTAAQQRSYVTYTISSLSKGQIQPSITLLEARNIVSAAGTTGFRTWEACLHLGLYLTSPSLDFSIADKNVLELGAGTGYLSILCAKYLGAAHVTATDGSEIVVADMSTNFYLNRLQETSVLRATDLKWGQALLGGEHEDWSQGRQIDVVLGADITYDTALIPCLVATLVDLIELFPNVQILVAATIRQENTFETFVKTCVTNGLEVQDINFPVLSQEMQKGPFYSDQVPIRICNITID